MNLQYRAMLTLTAMASSVVGSDTPLAASGTWRTTPFPLQWGKAGTYDLYFNQSVAKRVLYGRPSNLNAFTLQTISQYIPPVFTVLIINMQHNTYYNSLHCVFVIVFLFFPVSISITLHVLCQNSGLIL